MSGSSPPLPCVRIPEIRSPARRTSRFRVRWSTWLLSRLGRDVAPSEQPPSEPGEPSSPDPGDPEACACLPNGQERGGKSRPTGQRVPLWVTNEARERAEPVENWSLPYVARRLRR